MAKQKPKTKKELRKFGIVMSTPLGIIGGILFWKGKSSGGYFFVLAAFFLMSGLLFPGILRPIERIWMKFAEIISAVMTRVILTLTFYLVITPVGLLLRLMGKDLLQMKFEPHRKSYWEPVEEDGPCSRPDKPY
jgi:Saxitoxin biosynthesis operon protein SxtJ